MHTSQVVPQPPDISADTLLTIGELAAHTGLTPELLRTWEARHGFPEPTRLPSGHRRYTGDDVRTVRQVLAERERGVRLEQAIAAARRAEHVEESGSVYASLSARHPGLPSFTLAKRTLLALSWAIEDESLARANHALVVGTFQRSRYYGQAEGRWSDLARTARSTVVMADFDAHAEDTSPARVALPPDSPLLREWVVAVDGPNLSAALVAWELPGQADVPDGERHFEATWSVDRRVVRDTVQLTAEVGASLGSGASGRLLDLLEESPPMAPPPSRVAAAVFNRMVAYIDGTVLRGRGLR